MTPVQIRRYFRYIALHYLKHFFLLLFGLSFAVVFIDFLQNAHRLPDAFNLKILYLFYTWEYMLSLLYPITLLFALAWTVVLFVRQNVFVSLFSFGYSRKETFRPFFFSALAIYLLFILLQSTDFSYGRNRAGAILHHTLSQQKVKDLFFKFNNNFVYVRELDPISKILKGVTIFVPKGRQIEETIQIPVAHYRRGEWYTREAFIKRKRRDQKGRVTGYRERTEHNFILLKGYRPKVVKLIYQGKALRPIDGIRAWWLLHRQGLDSERIRATLYNLLLMPLFALALMPILFFKTPPYKRFVRPESVWLSILGAALLGWAFFFAMYRLGVSGTLDPDYGQLLPITLLLLYSLIYYRKIRD